MAVDTRFINSNGAEADDNRDVLENAEVVTQVHMRLLQDLDLSALDRLEPARARAAVEDAARTLVTQMQPNILGATRESIVRRVIDEAVGYGPIEPLLNDASISEVMVNAPDEVYYERDG